MSSSHLLISRRCEVLRVLLLLLIEPGSMSSLPPDLTAVLDKYAWESEDGAATEEAARFLTEEVNEEKTVFLSGET